MMAVKLTSPSVLCLQQKYRQKYRLLVLIQREPGNNPEQTTDSEGGERLKFGSRPDFNRNFDFDKELGRLPFPVNMGKVEMTESQKKQFIRLIYDHQKHILIV